MSDDQPPDDTQTDDQLGDEQPAHVLTLAEAAKALGVSPDALRKRIARRQIKSSRVGRTIIIPASEVERLLSGQRPERPEKPQDVRDMLADMQRSLDAVQAELRTVRGILEEERARRLPALPAPLDRDMEVQPEDTTPPPMDQPQPPMTQPQHPQMHSEGDAYTPAPDRTPDIPAVHLPWWHWRRLLGMQ